MAFLFIENIIFVHADTDNGTAGNLAELVGVGNFRSEDPESTNQRRLPDYASSRVACVSDWGEGRLMIENDINGVMRQEQEN